MKRLFRIGLLAMAPVIVWAQQRPLTFDDLWAVQRPSDLVLSPDGQTLAFTVTRSNPQNGETDSDLYTLSVEGGQPRRMTSHPGYDSHPQWSPDGLLLAFLSDRSGSRQIHVIDPLGGEAIQVSRLDRDIETFLWSPDGATFALVVRAFADTAAQVRAAETLSPQGTQARIIDRLPYRSWNHWCDGRRRQIWLLPTEGGQLRKIHTGDHDTPTALLGSGRDLAFSPDGGQLIWAMNIDSAAARSTNNDLYAIPVWGKKPKRLTENLANDNQPVYSPDGRYLAWRSMRRPGFESDQYDLFIRELSTGLTRNTTELFDLDVEEIHWGAHAKWLYFTTLDMGRRVIYSLEVESGKIRGLVHQGVNTDVIVASQAERLLFIRSRAHLPPEIWATDLRGDHEAQLTFFNHDLNDKTKLAPVEDFWFPSYDNKVVHGMLTRPPAFDPAKRYPVLLLIHGGPQGAWEDSFHPRWNAALFAARGTAVLQINIRGSKGYGQEFCDAVSRNWGGAPYRDLMAGLDFALVKFPFLDGDRLAAAGGSYGGYLVNWLATQTDRFRCLVSHAGIYDLPAFWGTTEELWFPEWEFGGTPLSDYRNYDRWSPLKKAKAIQTPMLIVHGALDYRVSVDQGLALFTALQQQGVPSRLLYFPDEGHFITQAANARLWWNTLLDWTEQWTRTP